MKADQRSLKFCIYVTKNLGQSNFGNGVKYGEPVARGTGITEDLGKKKKDSKIFALSRHLAVNKR